MLIRFVHVTGIYSASKEILGWVKERPEKKVIYFDGWDGFGASAVLRSIAAQVLASMKTDGPQELGFDRVIYIDCSAWKSRREMQRAIAEELELDHQTLDMFRRQDEEDDFNGLHHGSRDVIPSVAKQIDRALRDSRFMMIFLNGSDEEIDGYAEIGIPEMTRFRGNKIIWTFKKRSLAIQTRRDQRAEKLSYTGLFLWSSMDYVNINAGDYLKLVHGEAASIVDRYHGKLDMDPTLVADCCLLDLSLHYNFHKSTRFGWASHSSNYWMCDGILRWDTGTAREINNVLHREIRWDCDASLLHRVFKRLEPIFLVKSTPRNTTCQVKQRWISVTSQEREVPAGMQTIPATASSFFLAFERPDNDHPTALPYGMFKHCSNLATLVLSYCAFSFSSPPFLSCHGLRFLGLEHCKHKTREGQGHTDTEWNDRFLLSLWVLDLRHTEWDEILSEDKMDLMANLKELNIDGVKYCWQFMRQLQKRLTNLYRLRITKPMNQQETTGNSISLLEMGKLEMLDLSGNSEMKVLPVNLSKASSLEVLVLDGCNGLENVTAEDGLPPSLMSFSLDGFGPALSQWTPAMDLVLPPQDLRPSSMGDKTAKISIISLEGCTRLEKLFLRGLGNLVELDLSGTAIKTLDFTSMVVQVRCLRRLFLIGCEFLNAIIWDDPYGNIQPQLELLCIDTRAGRRTGYSRPSIGIDQTNHKSFRLQVHAILADARLARSLWPAIFYYAKNDKIEDVYFNIHITSSWPAEHSAGQDIVQDQYEEAQNRHRQYHDVHSTIMVGDAPTIEVFPQAQAQLHRHVEIAHDQCHSLESELQYEPVGINKFEHYNLSCLLTYYVESLHLHDMTASSATMPPAEWNYLRCRVERCPKLGTVFTGINGFTQLETMWASDLLMARSIWSNNKRGYSDSFERLRHLHLSSCPRLQFVLPACVSSFPSLETIHIIHCGDLRHVFVLPDDEEHPWARVDFPSLTAIHFHDLPMLRAICEAPMLMVAPALEAIKIRGCWGLRRMPAMEGRRQGLKKPTVEIEKDVWEALEWDGVAAGHHPSLFEEPFHSRYYKKKLSRVSVLR